MFQVKNIIKSQNTLNLCVEAHQSVQNQQHFIKTHRGKKFVCGKTNTERKYTKCFGRSHKGVFKGFYWYSFWY